MSPKDRKEEFAELQRVNDELSQSLERCRSLLSECRSKLAANSNAQDDEQEGERDDSRFG